MSFIRRGYVPTSIPTEAKILFHQFDESPVMLFISSIICFEEHDNLRLGINVVTISVGFTSYCVEESFEKVAELLAEKVVAHVE